MVCLSEELCSSRDPAQPILNGVKSVRDLRGPHARGGSPSIFARISVAGWEEAVRTLQPPARPLGPRHGLSSCLSSCSLSFVSHAPYLTLRVVASFSWTLGSPRSIACSPVLRINCYALANTFPPPCVVRTCFKPCLPFW